MPSSLYALLFALVLLGASSSYAAEGDVKPSGTPPTASAPAAAPSATPAAAPATPAAPANASPAAPSPGHSTHGETFDEGPRQKAYLMGGTGAVRFPVSTKNALAQQFFTQGVGQLHGFWYFEAERSFRQAAALDPDCAMAYWGMAMANANNDKRAKSFIEKAVQKKASASPREVAWIEALAASLAGEDTTDRRRKYVRALETLVQNDPHDLEAKAFLALTIWHNGSWQTEAKKQLPITSHQAVDTILDQIFAVEPNHPAHHYRVHLWDDEKPARALTSASLCGQASPMIAHMWHMPGHTYSKLHRYADAAWQQEASARADHAHMMRDGVLPDQIHNYAHNNEWLIRDLALIGRVPEAIELAKNMIELPRHPKYNTADRGGTSAGFGLNRLADVLTQYECWQQIVDLQNTPYFEPAKNNPDAELKRARMLGLAWFGLANVEAGNKQIVALEEMLKEKRAARYKAADEAEAKARGEKKSEQEIAKAMTDALVANNSGLQNIERTLAELRGYAALAANNPALARTELDKAKESHAIRKDQLARAYLSAGDNAQAESLARAAAKHPGEVYPLAVLVEVLHRVGKKAEAETELAKLRPLAAYVDLKQPVFARLAPIAAEFKLPADWRTGREPAPDVGRRPDLATLGPFRWQPTPAVSFSATGADGKPLSLDQYRGKPIVVIFYLGSGCLHCVEQLQKFAPLNNEFTAAGISLVAISSEPADTFKTSLAKLTAPDAIGFPLAVDSEHAAFKAYRAFDDFENIPLHGTFLIDAEGLIRWQDVSYEPFTNAKFLLDEAKRLLGQAKP